MEGSIAIGAPRDVMRFGLFCKVLIAKEGVLAAKWEIIGVDAGLYHRSDIRLHGLDASQGSVLFSTREPTECGLTRVAVELSRLPSNGEMLSFFVAW